MKLRWQFSAFGPMGPADPTITPPPCYSPARAAEIFGDAFSRAVELVLLSKLPGPFLEFGTSTGYTARWLAELLVEAQAPRDLWLYDSFEGFPEVTGVDAQCPDAQVNDWRKGNPFRPVDPEMIGQVLSAMLGPQRVRLVKGFYDVTLPAGLPAEPAALVHIDCDLYASTLTVLGGLSDGRLLQQGAVILFDDWNCNRADDRFGERRAAAEVFCDGAPYRLEPWFSYGWGGQACLVHEVRG